MLFRSKDDKGNHLFCVTTGATAEIGDTYLACNQVIDGELAVVKVFPTGVTKEDVLRAFHTGLVNAQQYLPIIASEVDAYASKVKAIFED